MFPSQQCPSPPHPGTKSSLVFSKPKLTIVKRNQTAQKRSPWKMPEEVGIRRSLLSVHPPPLLLQNEYLNLRGAASGGPHDLTCGKNAFREGHLCLF